MLHEAIKAYVAAVRKNSLYLISDKSRLTDWGQVKIDQIEFSADHRAGLLHDLLHPHGLDGIVVGLLPVVVVGVVQPVDEDAELLDHRRGVTLADRRVGRLPARRLFERSGGDHVEQGRDLGEFVQGGEPHIAQVRVATYKLPELVTLWTYATP